MAWWRIALFVVVVLVIIAGWHWYLWARLARDPQWTALSPRSFGIALGVLGASIPLGFVAMRVLPRAVHAPILWVVYGWMGLALVTLFVLLPLDLVRAGLSHAVDPSRRQALARIVAGTAGIVGAGLTGFGVHNVLSRVVVERVRVRIAKLPDDLSGYVIAQITDLHVGPTIGRKFVEDIVGTTNALRPDAIVITGDLADGSVSELGPLVASLADLRAKDGVFFVTGNHEYYSGVDEWLAHLRAFGIRVLRNERLALREGAAGGGLDLAGVDDHSAKAFGRGHGSDLRKALGGRDPSRALVLLAHQPKTIREAASYGIDLQLSGHTHGGQIWPWGYAVRLDQPHVAGLHDHDGAQIYVSRGTGYWGPPVRLGAPAEITRVELVRA